MTVNVDVQITSVDSQIKTEPYGEHIHCDNCGKPVNVAKDIITGGQLSENEWACCTECHDEMVERGCAFEELGDMTYRKQTY